MPRRNNRRDRIVNGRTIRGKLRPEEERFWQAREDSEALADERKLNRKEKREYDD